MCVCVCVYGVCVGWQFCVLILQSWRKQRKHQRQQQQQQQQQHHQHLGSSCSSAATSSTDSSDSDDRCDSSLGLEEDRDFPVKILPHLFLGNAATSEDSEALSRHSIEVSTLVLHGMSNHQVSPAYNFSVNEAFYFFGRP